MVRYANRPVVVGLIIGVAAVGGASADEVPAPGASPRVRVTAPTVSGKRLVAKQALRIGLIDTTAHVEYLEAAARRLLGRGKRTSLRPRLPNGL